MKITHYSNSFIVVEAGGTKLVCDPWRGIGNHGGWHSFPEFTDEEINVALASADLIYISHLHSDHFDPITLKNFAPMGAQFLIGNFRVKTLRNRLEALGATDIVELDPFKVYHLKGLNIALIPQMTSNSAGLSDDVNYDLDTSLIISDGSTTFFNQVDNPLSLDDLRKIKVWVDGSFGKVDIATFVCGAASEFPQCFLNLDRAKLAEDVIVSSLRSLCDKLDIVKPAIYFPAGGTYFIPGRHSSLNDYVAAPTFERLSEYLTRRHPDLLVLDLEGGKVLDVGANGEICVTRAVLRQHPDLSEIIRKHAGDDYPHDADKNAVDLSSTTIAAVFEQAESFYLARLQKMGIVQNSRITFELHDTIELTDDGNLKSVPTMQLALAGPVANGDHTLKIHLEKAAFMRCLQGQANWNQMLSGSLCLYERMPNIFYPTDMFSLNFLVLPR